MAIERHYSTADLADLLSLSTDTVLRAAQRGEIRSVRFGQQRRYPESAVQAWLEANDQPATVVNLTRRRHARTSTTRRTA